MGLLNALKLSGDRQKVLVSIVTQKALLEGVSDIFDKNHKSRKQNELQVAELYR